MDAREIMTTAVVTTKPSATLREALKVLEDQQIRHLPVLDDGQLVGMLSDRDVREYRLPLMEEVDDPDYASDLLNTPVSDVMQTTLVSLDAGESLTDAIDLMIEYGVGAVPVVDRHQDELIGIVSYVDVLKAVRKVV